MTVVKETSMSSKHKTSPLLLALFTVTLASITFVVDTYALVGHPATPVSVAGVARRTVRRTAVVAPAR